MNRAEAFEHWIRTSFVQMNTELENLYFAQADRAQVIGCGDPIKADLRDEGHAHVVALLAEGNTGDGFESAFGVLGSVGMYLGALRRHELTNPMREEKSPFPEASSLAMHVGASLGMAPRFSTGHLATYNKARAGVRKSFTTFADEFLFIDENTRGILSLQRAADALTSVVHLGVSSPVADVMFDGGEAGAARCHTQQRPADEPVGRAAVLLLGAALLQAIPGRQTGVSGRQCRGLFGHQRTGSALGSVPRQRSGLRAAVGRQNAVHAAGRSGAAAKLHDVHQPAG